jgi:EmrB/QacA subfamily drug resistance transporter
VEQAQPSAMPETPAAFSSKLAMGGLALVLFLVSLDQTIVGTAMPRIIAELNGFELYAWVTTAYLLFETAVIPIVGKLGDMYGRKWLTIIGVVVFLVTSALCGTAQSMIWLIIGRGLQGIGGGMIFATTFTLVADIYPDLKERARSQGLLFSVFTLSSIIGPVLGGWITDSIGWRWLFYINIPLGLATLFILARVLPQNPRQANAKIDYWGAITSAIGVIALLLSVELLNFGFTWSSPIVIGGLVIALVMISLFLWIETRVSDPIIPLRLFRNPTISATTAVMFLNGIAMFGVALYSPLYAQGVLGVSPSVSGMLMIPMVITMTVMGIVVGQLMAKFEVIKPFILGGLGVLTLSGFLLLTLSSTSSPWMLSFFLFVVALGMGGLMPATTMAIQLSADPRELGVVTAATQYVRSIGATIGTALIGTVVTNTYLKSLYATVSSDVPSEAVEMLHNPNALINEEALGKLHGLVSTLPNGDQLLDVLLEATRVSLTTAVHSGFWLMIGSTIIAIICALFIHNIRLTGAPMPGGPGH